MIALVEYLGGRDTGKGINFETSRLVIEPTELEIAVLEALELQYDHCAPTSRLCRLMPGSPSRTHLDYAVLKRIPFVLKESREVNRLIGYEPNPILSTDGDKPSYLSMMASQDGDRVVLQYLVSEQNVEGNSFNLPESAREAVHGEYTCQRVKGKIRYDLAGKDARKITGSENISDPSIQIMLRGSIVTFCLIDRPGLPTSFFADRKISPVLRRSRPGLIKQRQRLREHEF